MVKALVAPIVDWLWGEPSDDGYDEDDRYEKVSDPVDGDMYPRVTSPPRKQQAISCPIVRAEPRTMDEAAAVADEIKRQNPVVVNLEGVEREAARRIRDFIGGVTYGVNGYMRKIGSWVYVCSPFDMPIERLVLDPSRRGEDRFEHEYASELSEYQY